MKTIQTVVIRVLCLCAVGAGILLMCYPSSRLYNAITSRVPENHAIRVGIRIAAGGGLAALALLTFAPFKGRPRKGKCITFPDTQGETTIQLAPIEHALNRELGRRPEVKRIAIDIQPAEDKRRVRLKADVVLLKEPGNSTRDIATRLKDHIAYAGWSILGAEELTGVDLNILGVIVKGKASPVATDTITSSPAKPTGESAVIRPDAELEYMPSEAQEAPPVREEKRPAKVVETPAVIELPDREEANEGEISWGEEASESVSDDDLSFDSQDSKPEK